VHRSSGSCCRFHKCPSSSSGVLFLAGPAATPTPIPTPTPPPQIPWSTPTASQYARVSSDGDISVNDPWDGIDSAVASVTSMDIQDPVPEVNGAPEAPIEMPEWTWTLTFFKEKPTTTVESTDEYGHASTRTVTHYKVVSQKNNKPTKTAPAPTGADGTARPTTWTLKKDYGSDLAADIGIKTWAWGKSLVTVLPSLPPQTSSYSVDPQPTAYPYVDPAKNTDKVMQVIYPSGSVNPAARPQGGVGFYAAPSKSTRSLVKFLWESALISLLQSTYRVLATYPSLTRSTSHRTLTLCKSTKAQRHVNIFEYSLTYPVLPLQERRQDARTLWRTWWLQWRSRIGRLLLDSSHV